jgi:hypothetical protein
MHPLHSVKELIYAGCFPRHLVSCEVRNDGIAQLRGTTDALAGEQGKKGVRIVVSDLALLPFLNGPSGFADVVDGVAEIHKNALVDATGAHGLLKLQ